MINAEIGDVIYLDLDTGMRHYLVVRLNIDSKTNRIDAIAIRLHTNITLRTFSTYTLLGYEKAIAYE